MSEETKRKIGEKNKSSIKKLWENPEYRENMKKAHLGQVAWNKGLKTGIVPRTAFVKDDVRLLGDKHHNWVGDKVTYFSLHNWIARKLGKAKYCSNNVEHKSKCFHWANISGEYKRDVADFYSLCSSCNHKDGIKIASRFNLNKN